MTPTYGDSRSEERWNALRGRGGRRSFAAALAVLALALPVGAYADDKDADGQAEGTYVNADKVDRAEGSPNKTVPVIVRSRETAEVAEEADEAEVEPAKDASHGDAATASETGEATDQLEVRDAVTLDAYAERGDGEGQAEGTYVNADILEEAQNSPSETVRVIVQSRETAEVAEEAVEAAVEAAAAEAALGDGAMASETGEVTEQLDLIDAVAADLTAAEIEELAETPGLVIVPDAPVRLSDGPFSSGQLWPHGSGNSRLWAGDARTYGAHMPTIAIVDSGIEDRADFAGRIVADVKLLDGDDQGDSRGHGTFVAGIAAGSAAGVAGAAPTAPIFSIDVMDANGMAWTSDVIRACEVILDNKDVHNIRVANFSLHSAWPASVRWDPLAQAVEKLWFSGVVVVAAAGNYGSPDGPSGVPFAPGNDPFIITVGAGDLSPGTDPTGRSSDRPRVHSTAWWSAYGYTADGFSKPDVVAPGRYMVGPVPDKSTLVAERPGSVISPGYMQLSGTSFAAPVVAGTAAQMLARNPSLTPDQVKGALMVTARPVHGAAPGAAGVGQIIASKAIDPSAPPNPNAALNKFLVPDSDGGVPVFDAKAWGWAVQNDAAWSSAAWSDAAWSSAAWSSAAWADAAWASSSFEVAAWSDAAWSSAAWASAAWSDGAGDEGTSSSTWLTPEQEARLADDPELKSGENQPGEEPPAGEEPPGGEPGGDEPPAGEEPPPGVEPPAGEPGGEEPPSGDSRDDDGGE